MHGNTCSKVAVKLFTAIMLACPGRAPSECTSVMWLVSKLSSLLMFDSPDSIVLHTICGYKISVGY